MPVTTGLQIVVYDGYARTNRLDDLTDRLTAGKLLTGAHGGFTRAKGLRIPMSLDEISLYMERGNLPGRHFAHLEVTEGTRVVWEGRIMRPAFGPDGAGGFELRLEAAGYWNSLKDQGYTATVVSPDSQKDLIEDMITAKGPNISTDFDAIEDPGLDIGGLVLTRRYPQDVIVEDIANTSDGTDQWFAYVYADRGSDNLPKLIYKARTASPVHWTTKIEELAPDWEIAQDGYLVRTQVTPIDNGVAGTTQTDANRRSTTPIRDFYLTVGTGLNATAEAAEADRAIVEKKDPHQSQAFTIVGNVWDTSVTEKRDRRRLYWVRAGEVIRFENLFPLSAVNPALDSLRTFFIRNTEYDLIADTLRVSPDRASTSVTQALPRIGQLELAR